METKLEKYNLMLKQAAALIEGERELLPILCNVSALMAQTFPETYFWAGFYLVKGEELLLGPFQGTVACVHIKKGKGVCGTAWAKAETIIVPDVEEFPGHIACSSLSRSEIVVPIKVDGNVVAVIDIDSKELESFDQEDQAGLEQLADMLAAQIKKADFSCLFTN